MRVQQFFFFFFGVCLVQVSAASGSVLRGKFTEESLSPPRHHWKITIGNGVIDGILAESIATVATYASKSKRLQQAFFFAGFLIGSTRSWHAI